MTLLVNVWFAQSCRRVPDSAVLSVVFVGAEAADPDLWGIWRAAHALLEQGRWARLPAKDARRHAARIARHTQPVIIVAEIAGITHHGDRDTLEGRPLAAGHPVYDAYIGRPDLLANQSQNSVTYGDLPEVAPFRSRPCACGCGESTGPDFTPVTRCGPSRPASGTASADRPWP